MQMALHVFDGDSEWLIAPDLSAAIRWANQAIDAHRDWCDPEWPDAVELVAIYEAPADAEFPDEGRCVMIACPVDAGPAPDGSGFERWTEYKMLAPSGREEQTEPKP